MTDAMGRMGAVILMVLFSGIVLGQSPAQLPAIPVPPADELSAVTPSSDKPPQQLAIPDSKPIATTQEPLQQVPPPPVHLPPPPPPPPSPDGKIVSPAPPPNLSRPELGRKVEIEVAPVPAKKFVSASAQPMVGGTWMFQGEYLLLRPRRGGQDYAVASNQSPLLTPLGKIYSVEDSLSSGLRLGAGYRFPSEPWEVYGEFTYYNNQGNDQLEAAAGEILFPTLTLPTFVNQAAVANATSCVRYDLYDIGVGHRFDLSNHFGLRVFSGLRVGNLDQKFTAHYGGGPQANFDEVRRWVRFEGIGMRLGGEANFHVVDTLGLFFRSSASLLSGRFRADLKETADGVPIVGITDRFDRIVPLVDMGIGVNYQVGGLHLSVGYELLNWLNVAQGIDFVDDVNPAKLSRRMGDLGFDGLMFRARYEF